MIFAPHNLLSQTSVVETDDLGQPISPDTVEWSILCKCRCDDVTTEWRNSENGEVYQTSHHIVCDGKIGIKEGDLVRCVDGEIVKAEGEVYKVKVTNYFNYTEVFL